MRRERAGAASEAPDGKVAGVRRQEMLEHTLEIVRESGLASVTMKKVADRVGFTETAAYRYFPNKQALLLGLAEKLGASLLGPVRTVVRGSLPPAEKLERILRHHLSFVLGLDGLPILILAEAAATGETELLGRLKQVVDAYLGEVAGVLATIPGDLLPADPRLLSILVLGIPASLAIMKRVGSGDNLEEPAAAELIPFLVHCMTGSEEGKTR